jgi:ubiquinone/menaquinone biosynthesis C-methylase UbiE
MYKLKLNKIIDRSLNYGRDRISEFVSCIDNKGHKRILDIGAGHGDDLLIVKKFNPHAECNGIEIYEPYAEELRKKEIVVYSLNIEYDQYPFNPESIDLVIANQIIEHVKEIFWMFHEISRILKTGGSLIVGVPNLAAFHNRLLLLSGKQPSCIQNNSAHVRGYTRHDFLNFLNTCFRDGYNLRAFRGSNFYPFPKLIAEPLSKIFQKSAWIIFFLLQ